MFTQIVHLLPVLVRINRSERLEVGGVFLLSVAYDRDDTEKEKRETEKLGSATRICFAAYRAVLTWIIATRTTNAARVKNAWTFFSMPSQKARDKHTKRAVFQERRLLCHKLSSNARGHKKRIVQHTFLHRFLCHPRLLLHAVTQMWKHSTTNLTIKTPHRKT